MSRRLVILLVVLVLLILCCLGTLGIGRRSDSASGINLDLEAPNLDRMRSWLTQKIDGSALSLFSGAEAGCSVQSQRLIIPPGARCRFLIQPDRYRTRQLTVSLGGLGTSLSVRMEQENTLAFDQVIKLTDKPVNLDVYRRDDRRDALLTVKDCALVPLNKDEERPKEMEYCWLVIQK